MLTQIGTDVSDPQDEFDKAQQEKQDGLARDVNALNPQANLQQALDKVDPTKTVPLQGVAGDKLPEEATTVN